MTVKVIFVINSSSNLLRSIRLHATVSVIRCMIDYMIEMTCIYVCALSCFYHVKFYVHVYYHDNLSII